MLILILALCLISNLAFGDVVTYRYTDKITGDEKGLCYSGIDGSSPLNNPDWNAEVIENKDRAKYVILHKEQRKARKDLKEKALKNKKDKIKTKLKAKAGLTDEEVKILLGI